MKLRSRKRQEGGTLVVTLVMGITIGTVLGAYLSLVSNRYELTLRSQCWNAAIPVLEAGIEEAFTHLHNDSNSPGANGWTNGLVGGQTVYAKQRSFSDGSSYYTVIYNATSTVPYIYSTAFIPAPRHPDKYISRTVKVNGSYPPLFSAAFVGIYSIQMNGSSLAADSFNSSLPTLSTNGLYDPTKTSTNGNVGSVYGPVNLGQHSINGSLYLGPDVTSISAGSVSGQVYTDFNISYPDATLPNTLWLLPPLPIPTGKTWTYDFRVSGDYVVFNDNDIIVEPGVQVRLKVADASYVPANIHVMATNGVSGSLTIYQVSGNGTINNVTIDSGRARNFFYYGLPGVTSITYSGNTSFTGVIYAPEADLVLNGGGNNIGFIGACVAKSITMNGNNYVFHFDEDLITAGPSKGLVPASWQEL